MKKFLSLLIALMLLCPAALAQSYTAQWGDWGTSQFGLINFMFNDEGELIATNEEFCRLYAISREHGWFSATLCQRTPEGHHQSGGEALMDAEGNLLTGHIYSNFEAASANMIIAVQEDAQYNQQYSVLNEKGEVIVPPQDTRIALIGDDLCYTTSDDGQIILIHRDGSRTLLNAYICTNMVGFSHFVDHTYVPLLPASPTPDGKCGYIDLNGNWVIEPQYSFANHFFPAYEGADSAFAEVDGGLVDTQGRQIVPCGYESVFTKRTAIKAIRSTGDVFDIYSHDGEFLFSCDQRVQLFGDFFYIPETGTLLDRQGNEFAYNRQRFEPVSDGRYSDLALLRDRDTGFISILQADGTMLHTNSSALSPAGKDLYVESYPFEADHPGYGNCACSLFDTRYVLVDGNGNRILPGEYYLLIPLEGTAYYLFEDETGYGVLKPDGTTLLYVDLDYNRHVQVWG